MKKIRSNLLSIFLLFSFLEVTAQGGQINNITMSPLTPSQNDSITFVVNVGFPSGSCMAHYNELFIFNDSIVNISSYCYGTFYYVCQDIDTIIIPPLSPGDYVFRYSLHSYSTMSDCPFFYPVDSVDVNFSVLNSLGIKDNLNRQNLFNIYSTDNGKNLIIHLNANMVRYSNVRLTMMNLLGQKVNEEIFSESEYVLNINYPSGLYFVTIDMNGIYQTKKIFIKNNH